MSDFYLDYAGAGNAAARFGSRATELETAASSGAKGAMVPLACTMGEPMTPMVPPAANDLLLAASGRLRAYSTELTAMKDLINDTVTVTNEIDVAYTL